jgi:hypothetical protein
MNIELSYAFNQRHYRLAPASDGWQITYERVGATPVHQTFLDYETARRTYWRRIACTILLNPRPLRGADINGTLVPSSVTPTAASTSPSTPRPPTTPRHRSPTATRP